ncbi:MAG: hypothetical protein GWO04_39710, partial [Actinobacteria bacterium]|nr:hypothetical protein [Actinomycetota bacterium]NIS35693.1 hypothetical protein [Actinomycetota bacterium]
GGAIAEYNEEDNLAFRELAVLALPDLVLSPSAVTLTPQAPAPGDAVTVSVDVANLGGQTVRSPLLRLTDSVSAQVLERTLD